MRRRLLLGVIATSIAMWMTARPANAQPTDVRAAPGDQELVVSWAEVNAEASHDVYLAAEPGVTAENVDALALGRVVRGATSPLTVRGLDQNRDYHVVVAEVGGGGPLYSREIVGTPRGGWALAQTDAPFVSVATDPLTDGLVLAAGVAMAGCAGAGKVAGCDIYRSSDGGASWTVASAANPMIDVRRIAIRDGVGIAASLDVGVGEQILRSVDGGQSWAGVAAPAPTTATERVIAFDPSSPLVIYAGNFDLGRVAGESRIIKSIDGGQSWMHLPEVGGGTLDARAIAIDPLGGDIVWLGGPGTPVLARSTSGGALWTEVVIGGLGAVTDLLIDEDQPLKLWLASGGDVLRSPDGGGVFATSAVGFGGATIRALARDPAASILYVATSAGVFESRDDGASFARIGQGLDEDVVSLAFSHQPEALIAATTSGIYHLEMAAPAPIEPPADAGPDAGGGPGGGGCGCRSTSDGSTASWLLLVLLGVAFVRRSAARG